MNTSVEKDQKETSDVAVAQDKRANLMAAVVKGFKHNAAEITVFVDELVDGRADISGWEKRQKLRVQKDKKEQNLSRYKVTKANKAVTEAVDSVRAFANELRKATEDGDHAAIMNLIAEGLKRESVKEFYKFSNHHYPIDQDLRPLIEQPPVLLVNQYAISSEVDYRRVLRAARRQKAMDVYASVQNAWAQAKAGRRAEIEKSKQAR